MMTSTSTLSRNFPTLRYVVAPFVWVVQTRRRRWTAALILLAMIATPAIWWCAQLLGLPDIGEPFDVREFRSFRIPDERNAFALYREAGKRFKPLDPKFKWSIMDFYQNTPKPKSAAEARRWVEENRDAMVLFRQGTERPDALDLVSPTDPEWWRTIEAFWSFHELAQLEAGRLQQEGDMAGAWGWYRAALRATYHLGLRGSAARRMYADVWRLELNQRLAQWAADRRTTPAMIRQALDEVAACGAFTPSETFTLQAEYLQLEQWLDGPDNPGRYKPLARLGQFFKDYRPSHEQMQAMADAWRFWRREPERSRRLLRLMFANWLAYEAMPADRRPSPDANVFGRYIFYAFGPEVPYQGRALSPAAMVHWLNTATDAPALLDWWRMNRGFGPSYWFRTLGTKERASHRDLLIRLATELYRRDHGTNPPSDKALVGPYLKSLPDDGNSRDETVPVGGEAPAAAGSSGQESIR
jgi:hypothetical protein